MRGLEVVVAPATDKLNCHIKGRSTEILNGEMYKDNEEGLSQTVSHQNV